MQRYAADASVVGLLFGGQQPTSWCKSGIWGSWPGACAAARDGSRRAGAGVGQSWRCARRPHDRHRDGRRDDDAPTIAAAVKRRASPAPASWGDRDASRRRISLFRLLRRRCPGRAPAIIQPSAGTPSWRCFPAGELRMHRVS